MWLWQRSSNEGYNLGDEAFEEFNNIEVEIEGGLFYGDAASYEQHLDKAINKFSYLEKQQEQVQ
jgi:hypothetical protein